MINIEIFINEVSLEGQYSSQKEFETALKVLKSIFEFINKSLKQDNLNKKTYYTKVLLNYETIKGSNFQTSFNKIKQRDLKVAIKNIIFNKVNSKDWQTEKVHCEDDNFDYFDGQNYEDIRNTSLAEVTERQLQNSDYKYVLINFIDSKFQILHQNIQNCKSITIIKNNDTDNSIELDSVEQQSGLKNWLEYKCYFKLSQFKYDESSSESPTDNQTILRDDKKFETTSYRCQGRTIYKEKATDKYWYVDNLHFGQKAHLEVFDNTGKRHLGEADLDGNIDNNKSDKTKKIDLS